MYLEAILKSQDSLQSNKSIFHFQGGILCFRAVVGKKLKDPEKFLATLCARPHNPRHNQNLGTTLNFSWVLHLLW